jgi:hypothetical protein
MGVFNPNMYASKNTSIAKTVIPIMIEMVAKLSFIYRVIYSGNGVASISAIGPSLASDII